MKKHKSVTVLTMITAAYFLVLCFTGCGANPGPANIINVTLPWGHDRVAITDVYCTYGDTGSFPFYFTLENNSDTALEADYTWTLNDPMADQPVYQGDGSLTLEASARENVTVMVKKKMEYDPRFYVMYVSVTSNREQAGYYREQKSTYDWDYSVTPPVRFAKKPDYTHVWIDTLVEKSAGDYLVRITGIMFLPPERTAVLELDNISLSFKRGGTPVLLADMVSGDSPPFDMRFHDADGSGTLSTGDHISMNDSAEGTSLFWESRDDPSIHMYEGAFEEIIEEEEADAVSITNVTCTENENSGAVIEVEVTSANPVTRVRVEVIHPGTGGYGSNGAHVTEAGNEGDIYRFRGTFDNLDSEKGEQYLLVHATDGTNEDTYNWGKLP